MKTLELKSFSVPTPPAGMRQSLTFAQEGLQGDGADAEAGLSQQDGMVLIPCHTLDIMLPFDLVWKAHTRAKAAMWALGSIGGLKDVLQVAELMMEFEITVLVLTSPVC